MDETIKSKRPLIAITSDLMIRKDRPTAYLTMTYAQSVIHAGGVPVILPPTPGRIDDLISRFDAFIFSGGDDPKTEPFGHPTHTHALPVLEPRQSFETELINELSNHPEVPVLGICLGMQMLALCRGGTLNQHLPDTHSSHASHWDAPHKVVSNDESAIPSGSVYSMHRQSVTDPGELRVLATSPDGIIEAINDPSRAFTLAVQWHPERTQDPNLGQALFDNLILSASAKTKNPA